MAVGARPRAGAERPEELAVPQGPARVGRQAAVPRRLAEGLYLNLLIMIMYRFRNV